MALAKKVAIGAIIVAIIIGLVSAYSYLYTEKSSDTVESPNEELAITESLTTEESATPEEPTTQGKEYSIDLSENVAMGEG